MESDCKQTWREVLNPEEDDALMAFVDQINHAVETIDSVSPLNQLALQQTILLGGVLTKLIPLAERGFSEFNVHHKNARRKHIKSADSIAEYQKLCKNPLRGGRLAPPALHLGWPPIVTMDEIFLGHLVGHGDLFQ